MIRVLVVDDEAIVRDGLRVLIGLADDMEVVAEAADGVEAVDIARTMSPDVALVDIRMPRMDGIEATRRLLALPTPPRVLVLTTFDRNEYVYDAMKAGASGFLLKDVRRAQLDQRRSAASVPATVSSHLRSPDASSRSSAGDLRGSIPRPPHSPS